MTDVERLRILIFQMLMHMENELDELVQNRQRALAQMPTPAAALEYRDALVKQETWKEYAARLRSVLDFFRGTA